MRGVFDGERVLEEAPLGLAEHEPERVFFLEWSDGHEDPEPSWLVVFTDEQVALRLLKLLFTDGEAFVDSNTLAYCFDEARRRKAPGVVVWSGLFQVTARYPV